MVRFLEKLLAISHKMAETRELVPLLEYTIDAALELFNGEFGYVVLQRDDGSLDFQVYRDQHGNIIKDPEEQISHSILTQVLKEMRPVLIADAISHPDLKASTSVQNLQLRSVMCVPLISRSKLIGAIYIENRAEVDQFTDNSLNMLEIFAGQAAVAIDNALLNSVLELRVAERTAELEDALKHLESNWLEAVEFNRIQNEVLANVAHDLRAPLSTVSSALYMLEDMFPENMEEDQKTLIAVAIRTIEHVHKLTDDFFDVTRLQAGQLQIFTEEMDAYTYVRQIYEVGTALPWPKDVTFRVDLETNLPSIHVDATRIKQVVMNLLSNALKFTEKGSVTLYSRLSEDSEHVYIGVRDTGIGIKEADFERIFERLHQSGGIADRQKGGGLGLSISRELVNLHGGEIDVRSTYGEGSDFFFKLPVTPPDWVPRAKDHEEPRTNVDPHGIDPQD